MCSSIVKLPAFRSFFLFIFGMSFGLLAAAGVFTVFVAVGIIPRFAGRTHTADHVLLYEDMVILGTVAGCLVSVYERYFRMGEKLLSLGMPDFVIKSIGNVMTGVFGLFSGMFIGCLALAIAEMLDSIPIFARRIGFRHGLGLSILSMAAGKLAGSLLYFILQISDTAK